MASTNKTTNYQLSQFQSSDIPAWLTDYNGDMQKIDAGIHAAKTQAQGAANGVAALQTAVSGKQDRLTFDEAPTQNSTNPVTSGGIYAALQNVSVEIDAVPTAGSTKAVQSGGVYQALQGKQNTLTFDNLPTQNSQNPVTSGGVFNALQGAVGATKVPVYTNSQMTNETDSIAVAKSGSVYFVSLRGTTTARTSWASFSDSTSYKFRDLGYVMQGNPFNLPEIATPTRDYFQANWSMPVVLVGSGDTFVRAGSSSALAMYFNGANTVFYLVTFATDATWNGYSFVNVLSYPACDIKV